MRVLLFSLCCCGSTQILHVRSVHHGHEAPHSRELPKQTLHENRTERRKDEHHPYCIHAAELELDVRALPLVDIASRN